MPTFREDPKIGTKVPLIKTADLNDKSVTEKKLADGSITKDKIAIGAVTSEKLQHNAVTTETINDGAVTAEKIAEGAVSVDEIKDLSVEESKINNKAVTNVKIDDAAVDTRTIEDKSVTNAKIADESITQEKIFNSSVTTEKLADESVSAEKLQSGLRSTIVSTHDKAIELDKKKANVTDVDYALECLENKIGDRVVVEGNVTNLPDDEDLTSVQIGGREVVKLNDRAYEPSNFSGKGYKILRKNIQRLSLPTVTILVSNIPSSSGDIIITINGKTTTVALDVATDTTTAIIATKIGTALKSSLDDYDVSVSSNTIVLTRNNSKYASPSSIDVGNTTAGISVKDSITKSERKNVLTQDMINEPNTVYGIRYDFDLNGTEISIKDNCVLKFNGGSISNGTINGDLYTIEALRFKIFENVKFKGSSKLNNYYLIDWWVKEPQYEFVKENNSIDNYQDIQSAFDSGAENFIFSSDRYYYIKQTLLINGEINLFSDVEHKHFDGNDRAHRKEPPCLYSNEIVTLIEYKYKSNTYKGTIYIGSINLVCNKPFSNLSEKDVPILYIHADQNIKNTTVWGVVIKCNIKAKNLIIDLKEEYPDIYDQSINIYSPNYTGILIRGDYVNFSYIKIYSYICMTYYGIIIPNTENNHWITDVTIEGDTRCVIGGKFIGGGNPVRIFGSHQPEYGLAKTDEVRNVGYFVGTYIQLYGYIWDINQQTLESEGNCPKYPIQINSVKGDYNNPLLNNRVLSPAIRFIKNADLNFRNFSIKALFLDNVLNYIGSPLFTKKIQNFSLKLNNVDYTEYPQIYNTRYLFGVYPWIISRGYSYKSLGYNAYIITQSDEEISYKLHFELNSIGYTDEKELIIKCDTDPVYIKIQTKEGKVLVNDTYDLINSYYANSYFSIVLSRGNVDLIVDIETKIKKPKGTVVFLPLIKIPNEKSVFCNKANISDVKGDFIYDTTNNKAGWWNGKYWADINGYNIDYNVRGTTANRPMLKSTDEGFEYYDTTLKKKILWNGTEWTNMDGTALS